MLFWRVREKSIYMCIRSLLKPIKTLVLRRLWQRLHWTSCYDMLSLRTSQVKNINTYINYQDLTVFIETNIHKREEKFSLSRNCRNRAKVTRITYQMVCYFLFFLLYAHLAIAMTKYVNQNAVELYSFVCVFTFHLHNHLTKGAFLLCARYLTI